MDRAGLPRPDHCGQCGTPYGQLHEFCCSKELCPFCLGQLASCDCIHSVLDLVDEESAVVREYVDDSVEPLKGIAARWRAAVDAEGRIPLGKDIEIVFCEESASERGQSVWRSLKSSWYLLNHPQLQAEARAARRRERWAAARRQWEDGSRIAYVAKLFSAAIGVWLLVAALLYAFT